MPQPGAPVLSYPAAIPLSTRTLTRLADHLRAHRAQRRCRWRRLDPGRQALLVLAHLRNGDTYARLAAGFAIGTSTAWRYVREAIDLLAALADDLNAAVGRAARLAYAILDGTLIPIDRVADQKPYYSGKHKRHGVNVQVVADPAGRLVWASPALPGATHDLSASRTVGLIDALSSKDVMTFADKGYQRRGWHDPHTVQTPPPPSTAIDPAESRQPDPRPDPSPRRTRDRHPQNVESAGQAAVLPPPRHRARPGHPRSAQHRSRPLLTMKKAH
jgi:hypothetical protein